ncbi:MAG: GNAT family N-acetyltransferase [Nocardioidaceae bacterium]
MERSDAGRWAQLRRANLAWLAEWEASQPPQAGGVSASYRSMTRDLRRQGKEGKALPFALTYDEEMIGQVTVTGITWGSARWAQVGYWIDKRHAGKGIMPIAVALACDHCLGTMGLHRIEIAIRPENTASLRVVEKLGFGLIGRAPKFLHINGQWRDHLIFAVTTEDVPDGLLARLTANQA